MIQTRYYSWRVSGMELGGGGAGRTHLVGVLDHLDVISSKLV